MTLTIYVRATVARLRTSMMDNWPDGGLNAEAELLIVREYNGLQPELVIALNGRKVDGCRSHDEMSASPSG
jgi:hypothetical protein